MLGIRALDEPRQRRKIPKRRAHVKIGQQRDLEPCQLFRPTRERELGARDDQALRLPPKAPCQGQQTTKQATQ